MTNEDLQKQVDELKVLINRIEQVTHDGLTRYEIKQFKEAKGWIRE